MACITIAAGKHRVDHLSPRCLRVAQQVSSAVTGYDSKIRLLAFGSGQDRLDDSAAHFRVSL